jgi:Sulfotransferase family
MTQSGEMQEVTNRPIFVVGSPRSGTSILTWCLGQHPNIFPVPESSWMGDFAINIAIAYQIGAARGERSMLSAMDIREDELFASFVQRHKHSIRTQRTLRRRNAGVFPSYLRLAQALSGGAIHPHLPGCDFGGSINAALPSC